MILLLKVALFTYPHLCLCCTHSSSFDYFLYNFFSFLFDFFLSFTAGELHRGLNGTLKNSTIISNTFGGLIEVEYT